MLACPVCLASVRGAHLSEHLGSKHEGARDAAEGGAGGRAVLLGEARVARRIFGALFVAWCLGVAAVLSVHGGPPSSDAGAAAVGVTFVAAFGPLCAALAGAFRATLLLEDGTIRLRALGGLYERSVALPCSVAAGRLVERRVVPGIPDVHGEDVDAGAYLRLAQDGRAITVGARRAAGAGRRWAPEGLRKERPLRTWDVTVDRCDLVAREYHLASLGVLRPREG